MILLIFTIALTVITSAFCSALETMVLNATPLEIENLKKISKQRGMMLEEFVRNINRTVSAIMVVKTSANVLGASLAGFQFSIICGDEIPAKYLFPVILTIAVLFFSEILPKNIGILYRPALQRNLAYPLYLLSGLIMPISKSSEWLIGKITPRKNDAPTSDDEILLLANKGEKDGLISAQERDLIANSLSLDDVAVSEIMTPRTVVMAFEDTATVSETFKAHPEINFSRIPVYRGTIDNIVGIVRRRDILTAMANDKHDSLISDFIQPAVFVPENGSALSVLRQLIKKHQKMGIVVDEFASLTGVITLEDIFEHLLGSEIFETDDIAVDMRELARNRVNKSKAKNVKNSRKRS